MKYKTYEIPTPFRITALFSALDYSWDEHFIFKGEEHDFWEIVTVLAGEVEVVENAETYLLHRGDMILHAPGEFHRIKSAGGTSPHVFVVSFAHTGVLPPTLKEGIFTLEASVFEEYCELFSAFRDYVNAQDEAEEASNANAVIMARHRLEALLISLSLSRGSEKTVEKSAGAEEYRRLIHTMTEHVRQPMTIERLAALHHISPSYVKKLFYVYTGKAPMSYFSALRIKEIQMLLLQGYSVSKIAQMMGFSSSAYLSVFFKKKTGISPSKYCERENAGMNHI